MVSIFSDCSLRILANARYLSRELPRTACCSVATVSGDQACASPRTRNRYSPPTSSACLSTGTSPNASRWRRAVSSAIWSSPTPFDARRGAEEEFADEIALQADRVEDLRPAIRLIGRDAHLGHHLEDALVDRLDVALDDLLVVELLRHLLLHGDQRLEGEIGIDRLRAVAGETAEVMHLARFAGLDHEADRGAQALADQVMVHGRGREQRRDRNAVRAGAAVGQDDDVVAALHGGFGALAQRGERGASCRPRPARPDR